MNQFGNDVALLIIDVQDDFLEQGALAVPKGSEVIPIINQLSKCFRTVVVTQDWHPSDHISFVDNHVGKKPLELIDLPYGKQILWPRHCVQGTMGAALAKTLELPTFVHTIYKGVHSEVDSYSAFLEADRRTETGLKQWLQEQGIKKVYLTGLATDFCVSWSALDAKAAGFEVMVILDACRGIDLNDSVQLALDSWEKAGINVVQSNAIL